MGACESRAKKGPPLSASSSGSRVLARLGKCLPTCSCRNGGACLRTRDRSTGGEAGGGLRGDGGASSWTRLRGNIHKKYLIGRVLGNGAFGQVRECVDRQTKESLAVKVMTKKGRDKGAWSASEMFRREVAILSALSHPNIIRLVDAFEDRHHLYYVMDKCDGGELFEHIVRRKHFDECDASRLCRQMLLALDYLHSFNIVHRDVKAENFLFRDKSFDSTLVLIDFGMSARVLPDQTLSEVCGSPHYLSPELLRRQYSCPADMWALGVLVFLMLYGRYPYDGHTTSRIVRDILYKPLDFRSRHIRPSSLALGFIRALLEPDPNKRMTAQEALQHRWILEGDADARREKEEARIPIEIVRSAHRKVTAGRIVANREDGERRKRRESAAGGLHHPQPGVMRPQRTEDPCGPRTQNRYWYKGGWQRKPRVAPEYTRKNTRLATTPSRIQRRHQEELADILRDASMGLLVNRSSSLGMSEEVSRLPTVSGSPPGGGSDFCFSRTAASKDLESSDELHAPADDAAQAPADRPADAPRGPRSSCAVSDVSRYAAAPTLRRRTEGGGGACRRRRRASHVSGVSREEGRRNSAQQACATR
ncbi:CAM Kinase family, incomplete catalytic triad [Besnoitia besnoiti]|uniref:non-specific serine/threonine protein kinase n=1 Tax=Besnoitia besnoiti TaxID=94643 RepID=A0A2A9M9S8_BESBE|nr:CAM Kinase family, incomplete catalytic triad [Besnoitia besnoiti]PFH32686.1 CAM Kinase family, incomplete catalytic triad [Besnoitia besnoiti]